MQSIVMFLNRFGVTPNFALKVYKQFGSEAVDVIQENPYRLCEDIYGIGFKKADKIGLSLGVLQDDPSRVAAGVRYILQYHSQNGHCLLYTSLRSYYQLIYSIPHKSIKSNILYHSAYGKHHKQDSRQYDQQAVVDHSTFYQF